MSKDESQSLIMLIGEIKGDLKSLHEKMDVAVLQVQKTNGRVTLLEHWRTGLMAKVSIGVILVTGVWALILKKI